MFFTLQSTIEHTLGNIVAGNKVAGNTQCMVMMGPATILLQIDIGSVS